jgi:hypothetical protein
MLEYSRVILYASALRSIMATTCRDSKMNLVGFPSLRKTLLSRTALYVAFISLSVLQASCGGGGSSGPPPVKSLVSIAVTPSNPNLAKGLTQQFTATGTFSDTSTADLTTSATWSSGTPAIATVNATSGLATSVTTGSTIITATSGSVSGSSTLIVTPAVVANVWSPTGNLAVARSEHTATLLQNGKVLVAGGRYSTGVIGPDGKGVTEVAELYDPVAGMWSPTGSLTNARADSTATLLQNGKVLVAGGLIRTFTAPGGTGPTDSVELYDPATGTWSSTGNLAAARAYHTATLLPNGMVLVAGGSGATPLPLASAELYDPVAGTWSSTGNLSSPRYAPTATLLPNGKVLVAGGVVVFGPPEESTASAELYDPVAGTWSSTGNLATARSGHTATLLPNGMVLVAGGLSGDGATPLASAELYDSVAGMWSSTSNMSTARASFTATLLPKGTVLAIGGFTGSESASASAELYDPVAGTWSSTGSLSTPRQLHTATLLANGVELVAGGISDNVSYLNSVELYW